MPTSRNIHRGPNSVAPRNKITKVTEAQTYKCTMCGTEYKTQRNFPSGCGSILWEGNDDHICVCQSCLEKLYEDMYLRTRNENTALRRICMKFDFYFSNIIAERAKMARETEQKSGQNRSLIMVYISVVGKYGHSGKTYDTTVAEEENAKLQTIQDIGDIDVATRMLEDGGTEEDMNRDLFYFWGPGFTTEEYVYLQEYYEDWMTRYIIDSKYREETLKEICITKLLMTRALQENNIDQYNKCYDTWKKMTDAADLSPKAEKSADKANEVTLGELVKQFEVEGPIVEPRPEWRDVDGIIKLLSIYFFGHLCKAVGIKNRFSRMYEEEMDKFRGKVPELQDADDEEVFEFLMEKGGDKVE